jgi:hypothetical protein
LNIHQLFDVLSFFTISLCTPHTNARLTFRTKISLIIMKRQKEEEEEKEKFEE